MTVIGSLAFGAVLGWAAAFTGLTWKGGLFRMLAIGAAVLGAAYASGLALAALIGTGIGLAAHEGFIAAIGRRLT